MSYHAFLQLSEDTLASQYGHNSKSEKMLLNRKNINAEEGGPQQSSALQQEAAGVFESAGDDVIKTLYNTIDDVIEEDFIPVEDFLRPTWTQQNVPFSSVVNDVLLFGTTTGGCDGVIRATAAAPSPPELNSFSQSLSECIEKCKKREAHLHSLDTYCGNRGLTARIVRSSGGWQQQKQPHGREEFAAARRTGSVATMSRVSDYDIICGRNSKAFNHIGNRRFRITISMNLKHYISARTKQARSKLIMSIIDTLQKQAGARFLKVQSSGELVEMTSRESKQKVGHALRDMLLYSNTRSTPSSGGSSSRKIWRDNNISTTKKTSKSGMGTKGSALQPSDRVQHIAHGAAILTGEAVLIQPKHIDEAAAPCSCR